MEYLRLLREVDKEERLEEQQRLRQWVEDTAVSGVEGLLWLGMDDEFEEKVRGVGYVPPSYIKQIRRAVIFVRAKSVIKSGGLNHRDKRG